MITITLKDFGPHENTTFPLTSGASISGASGTGKTSMAFGVVWLLTGLDLWGVAPQKPDPIRDGATAVEATMRVDLKAGPREFIRRRTAAGTPGCKMTIGGTSVGVKPEDLTAEMLRVFKAPDAKTAVLLASPVYWLKLARSEGGRPLMTMITDLLAADIDPLAGEIADHEPRDAGRAETWRREAKKNVTALGGSLAEAQRSLDAHRERPAEDAPDAGEVEAARGLVATAAEQQAAHDASVKAHGMWRRAFDQWETARKHRRQWEEDRPTVTAKPADVAPPDAAAVADVARLQNEAAALKDRVTRLRALLEVEERNASAPAPEVGTVPGCAALKQCEFNPELRQRKHAGAVAAAVAKRDALAADLAAAQDDLTKAQAALTDAKARADAHLSTSAAYQKALAEHERTKAELQRWQAREVVVPGHAGDEPEIKPAPQGVAEAAALIARAEAAQKAAAQWAKRLGELEGRVADLQRDHDAATATAARADAVLALIRGAPAAKLAAAVAKLDLGPVTLAAVPDNDGFRLDVRLFGAPLERASTGQIVAGGAWLRLALRDKIGSKVPVFIDEAQSARGVALPGPAGTITLTTTDGPIVTTGAA